MKLVSPLLRVTHIAVASFGGLERGKMGIRFSATHLLQWTDKIRADVNYNVYYSNQICIL